MVMRLYVHFDDVIALLTVSVLVNLRPNAMNKTQKSFYLIKKCFELLSLGHFIY